MPVRFDVDVASSGTTAVLYVGHDGDRGDRGRESRSTIVLGHGAGGRQSHPWMVGIADVLSARGFDVVTFDFLYTHAGRRMPDKNDTLEATWRAVIASVRARTDVSHENLFIGGKSMGGRIATQVAAGGGAGELTGLVLLGYPLHPPGKPEKLRSAHLPSVRAPMLFVQGSKDTFGTPEELAPIVAPLAPSSRLFIVQGGDHSLVVRGEPLEKTLARVADEVVRFSTEER